VTDTQPPHRRDTPERRIALAAAGYIVVAFVLAVVAVLLAYELGGDKRVQAAAAFVVVFCLQLVFLRGGRPDERGVHLPDRWTTVGSIAALLALPAAAASGLDFIGVTSDPDHRTVEFGPTPVNEDGRILPVNGTRIVKISGVRNAFVVRDEVAHSIPDGGTYICSASYYPVEFDVSPARWEGRVKSTDGDARCPAGPAADLRPQTVTNRYLLIEHDETQPTDPKEAIWEVIDGRRVPVLPPTGRVFRCLTRGYLAWDFVSPEVIRRFPRDRSRRAAECSD
jgi:hypothetical protein